VFPFFLVGQICRNNCQARGERLPPFCYAYVKDRKGPSPKSNVYRTGMLHVQHNTCIKLFNNRPTLSEIRILHVSNFLGCQIPLRF